MKKFEHLGKSLSKMEQKKIMGGAEPAGQCFACYGGPGLASCWYSNGSCENVCGRVYPNASNPCVGPSECGGCHMN